MNLTHYLADSPPSVVPLAVRPHFEALTKQQKLYAHHLSRAAFFGSRAILRQVSPESESIYDLIVALHTECGGDWDSLALQAGVPAKGLRHFLEYAAQFLGNMGNYKGFGDSKFVPRCSKAIIEALSSVHARTTSLCKTCIDQIFADESRPALMHLGFPDKGHMTNYYPDSSNISEAEIEQVDTIVGDAGLLPENTRMRKTQAGDFEILIASGESSPAAEHRDLEQSSWTLPSGAKISLIFGDHGKEMAQVASHMRQAARHAANERQKSMMEFYATSFSTGSLLAFKESQKLWVKDVGPAVESNIGFIENYRDPAGLRAEWEGMVATVNQERTRAFKKLVDAAPEMIPKLPWGKDFEKDVFTPPDFTSLEVLSFPSSGIPAGINIPNYDDIRQTIGFKNVSLGNVLSAKAPNEAVPFIRDEDLALYQDLRDAAFEVQVGIHELLGHGTGKLLQETEPGKFNFDRTNPPTSPISGRPVSTYYKPQETWSTCFGAVSSSYEECRAECVAMALSCDPDVLKIFGFTESTSIRAADVLYISYLSMARAGIAALEFWDPKSQKWGQAHMQARFSILKTFLNAGSDFCKLNITPNAAAAHVSKDSSGPVDVLSDLRIEIDRGKILSHGRPAVESYLQKLHVFKSTADVKAGRDLYEEMTRVDGDFWRKDLRDLVLKKKTPRKVFVQPNTIETADGNVELREYDASLEGMIQSCAERQI